MARRDDRKDWEEFRNEFNRFRGEHGRADLTVRPDMTEAEIDAVVRKRVARRLAKRREFLTHFAIYVFVNLLLWGIFTSSGLRNSEGFGFPWPMFVSFFWGIGVISHGVEFYNSLGRVEARREERIQREVDMERVRLGLSEKPKREFYEKPKRDPSVRVGDDGELISDEEEVQPRSQQQGGRL